MDPTDATTVMSGEEAKTEEEEEEEEDLEDDDKESSSSSSHQRLQNPDLKHLILFNLSQSYFNHDHSNSTSDLVTLKFDSGQEIDIHKMVLVAISPTFRALFRDIDQDSNLCCISMSDFLFDGVKSFFDSLYGAFAAESYQLSSADFEVGLPTSLSESLQLGSTSLFNLSLTVKFRALKKAEEKRKKTTCSTKTSCVKKKKKKQVDASHDFIVPKKKCKTVPILTPDKLICRVCGLQSTSRSGHFRHQKMCITVANAAEKNLVDPDRIPTLSHKLTSCSGVLDNLKIEDAFCRNEDKREKLWKMKKTSIGALDLGQHLEDCLDEEVSERRWERRKATLRAIIGITSKDHQLYGKPLAWSDPSNSELTTGQFESYVSALKHLYGYSDADLHTFPDLVGKNENVPISMETMAERKSRMMISFKQQTQDCLRATYAQEISMANKCFEHSTGENTKLLQLVRRSGASVTLDPNLQTKEFTTLAVVLWNSDNPEAVLYPILPTTRRVERSKGSQFCVRVLVDVWCTNKPTFPFSSYILEMYQSVCETVAKKETLESLLPGDDRELWLNCERQQQYSLQQQPQPQQSHPQQQFFQNEQQVGHNSQSQIHSTENIPPASSNPEDDSNPSSSVVSVVSKYGRCNCTQVPEFEDASQKRRHMMLHHSDGKYQQCKDCSFLGTHAQVKWHISNSHKEFQCGQCSKTFKSQHAALEHATKQHDAFRCQICNIQIVGKRKFRIHMDRSHTGTWKCSSCNSEFNCRSSLRTHEKRMHIPDDQKPHRCEFCGKGFIVKSDLRIHLMNVHIKSRPYACQYGCGATYNDVSNRAKHERKKHGALYDSRNDEMLTTRTTSTS